MWSLLVCTSRPPGCFNLPFPKPCSCYTASCLFCQLLRLEKRRCCYTPNHTGTISVTSEAKLRASSPSAGLHAPLCHRMGTLPKHWTLHRNQHLLCKSARESASPLQTWEPIWLWCPHQAALHLVLFWEIKQAAGWFQALQCLKSIWDFFPSGRA